MTLSLHHHLYDSGRALVLDGIQGLTDADLVQLNDLSQEQRGKIRVLVLSHTPITGHGIGHLGVLPNLKALYLQGTRISDYAPFDLLPAGVELVNLDDTRVGDLGVAKLSSLPQLRKLRLQHTAVTDHSAFQLLGVETLRNACLEDTAVTDLAKQRLENNLLLKTMGFSTPLQLVHRHAGRLLRLVTLQTRPNLLKIR